MLFSLRQRQAVVVVPAVLGVAAAALLAFAAHSLASGQPRSVVLGALVVGAFVSWACLDELCWLTVRDGRLQVRGPFRTSSLVHGKLALGLRCQRSSRSGARYHVFATDGEASADIQPFSSESSALRAKARLERELLPSGHRPAPRALREVERVEGTWRKEVAEAQRVIDQYYQSPAWKRLPWLVGVGLALYALVVLLIQFFG